MVWYQIQPVFVNLLVRQYFNFLLLLLIFTIVYICFCDVIQTIIKYEKKKFFQVGEVHYKSQLKGVYSWRGLQFFLRKSCLKSDRGIFRGEQSLQRNYGFAKRHSGQLSQSIRVYNKPMYKKKKRYCSVSFLTRKYLVIIL